MQKKFTILCQEINNDILHLTQVMREFLSNDVTFGKRFFYETKINTLLAPFAEFYRYIDDKKEITVFNEALTKFDIFTALKKLKLNNEAQLALEMGFKHFCTIFSSFCYEFISKEDYENEFGFGWNIRIPVVGFYEKGAIVATNIFKYILDNRSDIHHSNIIEVIDDYLRDTIARKYRFTPLFTRADCQHLIEDIQNITGFLHGNLSIFEYSISCNRKYMNYDVAKKIVDFFQYPINDEKVINIYHGNEYKIKFGCEYEFEMPRKENLTNHQVYENVYAELIARGLSQLKGEKNKYCYSSEVSDGVLHFDMGMPLSQESVPLEYATKIIDSEESRDNSFAIIHQFFRDHQCFVDETSGFHVHFSKENLSLNAMKRIAIRMARHEKKFDEFYHEKEREDYALYSTPFLTKFNIENQCQDQSLIIFAGFVNLAETENDIKALVNLCDKYSKLNFLPPTTIETRASHATLDQNFIKEYIRFFQEFIISAMDNNSQHYIEEQFKKVVVARQNDKTYQRKHELYNLYFHFDRYNPLLPIDDKTITVIKNYSENCKQGLLRGQHWNANIQMPNPLLNGNHRVIEANA